MFSQDLILRYQVLTHVGALVDFLAFLRIDLKQELGLVVRKQLDILDFYLDRTKHLRIVR